MEGYFMPEVDCKITHLSVEDAIACARTTLNLKKSDEHPMWGTKTNKLANFNNVIGFKDSANHRRWRLDYDPNKGLHLNEEDFTGTEPRKVCHKISTIFGGENIMYQWWHKWSAAGKSGYD
jgi:hypothetical protein